MQDIEYLFKKKGDLFDFLPWFCWTFCQKSLHDQPLLD